MLSKVQKHIRTLCGIRRMHRYIMESAVQPALEDTVIPRAPEDTVAPLGLEGTVSPWAPEETVSTWVPEGTVIPRDPEGTVTCSFGRFISEVKPQHLSPTVLHRSKRMLLDSIGVGLMGSTTEVFELALQHCKHAYAANDVSCVYGRTGTRLSPTLAAFVNGVATHSMDFDDTWHPATHPSGAVLPALLATCDLLPAYHRPRPRGLDLLTAFNVGVEIQGRLLRFSNDAYNIPKRFHPPSVVGTMGSAAACARLLSLDSSQCSHALAIAASLAGAPMCNAATQFKPFHIGNASRLGMEAALLASQGLEASLVVLDAVPGVDGFNVFYEDYVPRRMTPADDEEHVFLLEGQDVAFKRFPAHLGMHWVAEAAAAVHAMLTGAESFGPFLPLQVHDILLRIPHSKYINRPFPNSEHEARHSFQLTACSALLDGEVTVWSFSPVALQRPELLALLSRVRVEHPGDNPANFDRMYCEVQVTLAGGDILKGRCDTFYGHWRNPLSTESLRKKFCDNAGAILPPEKVEGLLEAVEELERLEDCTVLLSQLQ